jgi:Tfp pilus assembly protein PilN
MHEMDLMPPEFLQARQRRHLLGWALAALLLLLLATGGARAWLQAALAREQPRVAALRTRADQGSALRTEWLALAQREQSLRAQAQVLTDLRQGAAWPQALMAVDQAWTPRLWLDQLSATAPAASLAASATPAAPPAAGVLELRGHALDHATLTDFIHTLGQAPGLGEVRLTQSGLHRFGDTDVVDFELHAALRPWATTTPPTTPPTASGAAR